LLQIHSFDSLPAFICVCAFVCAPLCVRVCLHVCVREMDMCVRVCMSVYGQHTAMQQARGIEQVCFAHGEWLVVAYLC